MRLDGETRLIPILGDPIAQVKSPALLSDRLAAEGANAIVPPVHVRAEDFRAAVEGLKRIGNLDGFVITIPHKFVAAEVCDRLSDRAAFLGSANVVRREADGAWFGDHCDGQGYVAGVRAQGARVEGAAVLLIGAGGAGSAIAYEFLNQGAASVAVHDADAARRAALIARLEARFPGRARAGGWSPKGFDLVANATPMGMRPEDPFPADPAQLEARQFVADCVTRPEETPMILRARALGCATMIGLGMFNGVAERMADFFLRRA